MFTMLQSQQDSEADVEVCHQEMHELCEEAEARTAAHPKLPKPMLKQLEEGDFLATFERIAKQYQWSEEVWSAQLAGLLTGKVMAVYTSLNTEDCLDYEKVKKAGVNCEIHHQRFRREQTKYDKSYQEWICHVTDHFDKWVREASMALLRLIFTKQVLQMMPDGLAMKRN